VYLDFFMSQLLARRLQRAGKLSFSMDEKNREDVTEAVLAGAVDESMGRPHILKSSGWMAPKRRSWWSKENTDEVPGPDIGGIGRPYCPHTSGNCPDLRSVSDAGGSLCDPFHLAQP
jgi:hypothetical protein